VTAVESPKLPEFQPGVETIKEEEKEEEEENQSKENQKEGTEEEGTRRRLQKHQTG